MQQQVQQRKQSELIFSSVEFLLNLKKPLWVKKQKLLVKAALLAYLDSNQDKQNQNLSYYHYTIGQSTFRYPNHADALLGLQK